MRTFTTFLAAAIAKIVGESAPAKIARKQSEIATVVDRNTATINATINNEIDSLRTTALSAFGRIDQLLSTGALGASKARAVETAKVNLDKVIGQLDAAF